MNDIVRKLAKIVRIDEIKPIENADSICQYVIGGWKVVDSIGKYSVDELVVYCEVDSWIPTEIAPFLSKGKEPREFNGVKGERLRTIKLRGALSQGLLLPITLLANLPNPPENFTYQDYHDLDDGDDVTNILNIQKWEAPENAQLAGQTKGTFPHFIRKTDEERCLSGDCMVITDNGEMSIKDICESTKSINVLTFNHENSVTEYKEVLGKSVMSKTKKWLKITTESGKTITATENHKFFISDLNCYRLASDLVIGDSLKIIDNTD